MGVMGDQPGGQAGIVRDRGVEFRLVRQLAAHGMAVDGRRLHPILVDARDEIGIGEMGDRIGPGRRAQPAEHGQRQKAEHHRNQKRFGKRLHLRTLAGHHREFSHPVRGGAVIQIKRGGAKRPGFRQKAPAGASAASGPARRSSGR
jgi:hypothetical protein